MTMTPPPAVLVLNRGSSTVKRAALTFEDEPQSIRRDTIDMSGSAAAAAVFEWIAGERRAQPVVAIGHRVAHGGDAFVDPVRLTDDVLEALRRLTAFAPNHLPDELALIDAVRRAHPDVPQIACFDTAFHRGLPDVARRLPVSAELDAAGVHAYGFHGLSYTFLLGALARAAGAAAARGRVVLAHLGSGSSLAAVRDGRPIDTTMTFTPTGGIVMSTRAGDVDPGLIVYLARRASLGPDAIERLLTHESGLRAISGVTGDVRTLLEREPDDPRAGLAVDVYCYRIRKTIGAFAAALGGLDTIVFSGGIGEHAAAVRARVCDGLAFLGVAIDAEPNDRHADVISTSAARVSVRVIPTDEELVIARAVRRLLVASEV